MRSTGVGLLGVVVAGVLGSVAFGSFTAASDVGGQWVGIGPSTVAYPDGSGANSARIASIAVDPTDPTHWLVGVLKPDGAVQYANKAFSDYTGIPIEGGSRRWRRLSEPVVSAWVEVQSDSSAPREQY